MGLKIVAGLRLDSKPSRDETKIELCVENRVPIISQFACDIEAIRCHSFASKLAEQRTKKIAKVAVRKWLAMSCDKNETMIILSAQQ